MHLRNWRNGKVGLVAPVVAGLAFTGVLAVPAGPAAASVTLKQVWSVALPDTNYPVAQSSPSVATLDTDGPSVLVGDRAGRIYALHLRDGTSVAGWPASTGGVPVDSTPSSSGSTVFVGAGNASTPNSGGYESFAANGGRRWVVSLPGQPGGSGGSAVEGSLAVGNLQGVTSVVAGTIGQQEDSLNAGTGHALSGFPWFEADSNFSSPALADLYSSGRNEIIEGGDSTYGFAENVQYYNGGHVRVLSSNGSLLCEHNTDQVVQSSPAVGQFLGGGAVGIAVGTGHYYSNASTTNKLLALDSHCNLKWQAALDGWTNASPALADALGNGQLQVIEGTQNGSGGSVWLLNGSNGQTVWRVPALGAVIGGVSTVDLGGGYQDAVVASTGGLQILDGKSGTALATAGHWSYGFQNVPLVTDDPNGTVGITVAGYNANNQGVVVHYEVGSSQGSRVNEKGSWRMFHHDPQLTGDAGTPPPAVCKPPSTTPHGYYLDASDGGIFTFGNLPFCGSTGGIALNQPIVGMAATSNAGGYWLVAADGGIFAFGNAHFYGSTGGKRLNQPIVGMAATPDGKGYWLVARDGGIFAFGDAKFHGSTGGMRLAKPIVGMTTDRVTWGYQLVASDGGIFAFDAPFYGSTGGKPLNQPIVGMAAASDSKGYWLVARDGGIFAYGSAKFHGSTGGMRLAKPIVGMTTDRATGGYWLVASDGGIFAFDAPFYGSTGGKPLIKPIVGMSGF